MPLPKEHTYTIKDIYALPEGERAELIDGLSEYRYEEDAAPMIAPFDQTLTVGIYGDFEINIAKLLEEAGIK